MPEPAQTAVIRKLTIDRFRGLINFSWCPDPTMNVLLGGGDVGKSTVLEAIALLFSQSNASVVSESDYWQRDSSFEFVIEAIVALPDSIDISKQKSMAWPWVWDGLNAQLPSGSDEGDSAVVHNPVYRLRVRGSTDLELFWEVIQPNGDADHLSTALRRKIGLVRLSADERNDRDLRLVYGSALDRLVADNALRARIGKQVSDLDLLDSLSAEGITAIENLDTRMLKAALPTGLNLALTTSQGLSIGALIGLFAMKEGVSLPLSSWGAGTRRMSTLEIASAIEDKASLTTIDEIERGLEPYRLRKLVTNLLNEPRQSFVTTHSPVVVACTEKASLWYLDVKGAIGPLAREKIRAQQRRDPETFLSRVAVIVEGQTEVGFLRYLLEKAFGGDPLNYGVRVCDGQGNESTLELLEAVSTAGLLFAGFADNEGNNPGRWSKLKLMLGTRLLQWSTGCTEQNVISNFPEAKLTELLKNGDGTLNGDRLRTLADRMGIQDKQLEAIQAATLAQGKSLHELIIEAAIGGTNGAPPAREKAWKKHSQYWFKSEVGGRQLAVLMLRYGAWQNLQGELLPLINSILHAAGKPPIATISDE
jgi:putative ATP-dependent endonuclease of the OLD family